MQPRQEVASENKNNSNEQSNPNLFQALVISKEAPNYLISTAAGTSLLFLAFVDGVSGCGGSAQLTLGTAVAFLAMGANQYGLDRSAEVVSRNAATLFNAAKLKAISGLKQAGIMSDAPAHSAKKPF